MEQLKLDLIIRSLEEKIVSDISVIDVSEKTPFFSYYVIATIKNFRQGLAVVNEIEDAFEKSSLTLKTRPNRKESAWLVIDCGEILVHLFLEEERKRISLEKLLENN